tara:strand:+ start:3346 stop:4104 length:759 start_codon:yes stop_codon:yes gene_type:complete
MGNTPAKQNNWDNIETDAISSTIPYMKGISKDAQILSLKLGSLLDSESEVDQPEKVFMSKYSVVEKVEDKMSDELSATSPFITSDMYNAIMKNKVNKNEMKGGAIHKSSSTSSTSDIEKRLKKSSTENLVQQNNSQISSENSMSGGEFNYLSSSAHTEGDNSEVEDAQLKKFDDDESSEKQVEDLSNSNTDSLTQVDTDSNDVNSDKELVKKVIESSSENLSTIIHSEKSNKIEQTSSSINTADINMISVSA